MTLQGTSSSGDVILVYFDTIMLINLKKDVSENFTFK